jgi:1-acyl-sn-glycerol-3-phosphate acyltransferase
MQAFWKYIFFKLMGWSISGDVPRQLNKYLIIVAPHTSNWDFIIGLFVRRILNFRSSFLAKHQLFKGPAGALFRKLGGYPVYRNASYNMVDQVVNLIKNNDHFVLAITPEGTRGNVQKWKTGFYYIALKSGIPLVMAVMDYSRKNVTFTLPYYPTGNAKADEVFINNIFMNAKGLNRKAAPLVLNEKTG